MSSGPSCASAGSTIITDITDNPAVAGAKPSAAGATIAKAKWRQPEFKMQLQVSAGYCKPDLAVESDAVFVTELNATVTFIKISKNFEWLVKMTSGATHFRHGALKRTTIIDQLLEAVKCHSKAPDVDAVEANAQGGESAVADAALDPMSEVAALEAAVAAPEYVQGKTSRPKRARVTGTTSFCATMPARCPAANPRSTEQTQIRLLSKTVQGRQCYIAASDLGWLLLYLADEVATGGVPMGDEDTLSPNCNVPWLYMRLDMAKHAHVYIATFTDGPLKGTTIRTSVDDLTEDKWTACIAASSNWQWSGVSFGEASCEERARATTYFLEAHCARKLLVALGKDANCDDPIQAASALTTGSKAGY
jgi:hypothetical protein